MVQPAADGGDVHASTMQAVAKNCRKSWFFVPRSPAGDPDSPVLERNVLPPEVPCFIQPAAGVGQEVDQIGALLRFGLAAGTDVRLPDRRDKALEIVPAWHLDALRHNPPPFDEGPGRA